MTLSSAIKIIVKMAGIAPYHRILILNAGTCRCWVFFKSFCLTHISLASLLLDIGKQNSPRCDAAERGVPSGTILFAKSNLIEK